MGGRFVRGGLSYFQSSGIEKIVDPKIHGLWSQSTLVSHLLTYGSASGIGQPLVMPARNAACTMDSSLRSAGSQAKHTHMRGEKSTTSDPTQSHS